MTPDQAKVICARRARDVGNALTAASIWIELLATARREFLTAVPQLFTHDQIANVTADIGAAFLDLPTGFTEVSLVHSVRMVASGLRVMPQPDIGDLYDNWPDWSLGTASGEPRMYKALGGKLYVAPVPDAAYAMQIAFRANLADVAGGTEYPEPSPYHDAYIEGALERRMIDDENDKRASYHHGRFMEYVKIAHDYEPNNREERYPQVVDSFYDDAGVW